jgi:hypothetical protein
MVERAANQKADGEARSNFAKSACKAPDFQGIVCISHPASRPPRTESRVYGGMVLAESAIQVC